MATLRVDKIEIQQQPERKRFWAEVEVMAPNGFRRKVIMTPNDQGHWGMLRAIGEYLDEFLPKPVVAWEVTGDPAAWPERGPADAAPQPGVEWLSAEDAAEVRARAIPVLPMHARDNPEYCNSATEHTLSPAAVRYTPSPAYLDALRAEAEAAGVRVDRRWGEARLRDEIAAVARGGAPQDA